MNKEIVVYTCNVGSYDKIREPVFKDPKVSYFLFTDNKCLKCKVWEIVYIDSSKINSDPQRVARYIKTHSHTLLPKTHKISIWVDSCYQILVDDFVSFCNINLHSDISLYKHPKRNSVYDEFDVCHKLALDYTNLINVQKEKYIKEGFPAFCQLYHTALILRKNNEIIKEFNKLWWQEISNYSKRDQLSFSYCLWKLNLFSEIINNDKYGDSLYKTIYFLRHKHQKKRNKYV